MSAPTGPTTSTSSQTAPIEETSSAVKDVRSVQSTPSSTDKLSLRNTRLFSEQSTQRSNKTLKGSSMSTRPEPTRVPKESSASSSLETLADLGSSKTSSVSAGSSFVENRNRLYNPPFRVRTPNESSCQA